MGGVIGTACHLAISCLPATVWAHIGLDLSVLQPWHWIAVGIVLVHSIPLDHRARRQPLFSSVEAILGLIERSPVSEAAARGLRRQLIASLMEQVRREPVRHS
jgi:hypothetical protein